MIQYLHPITFSSMEYSSSPLSKSITYGRVIIGAVRIIVYLLSIVFIFEPTDNEMKWFVPDCLVFEWF